MLFLKFWRQSIDVRLRCPGSASPLRCSRRRGQLSNRESAIFHLRFERPAYPRKTEIPDTLAVSGESWLRPRQCDAVSFTDCPQIRHRPGKLQRWRERRSGLCAPREQEANTGHGSELARAGIHGKKKSIRAELQCRKSRISELFSSTEDPSAAPIGAYTTHSAKHPVRLQRCGFVSGQRSLPTMPSAQGRAADCLGFPDFPR